MHDSEQYLQIVRVQAGQLRRAQQGQAWDELREMLVRLVVRRISDHRTELKMADERPGVGSAICVAVSDREAALRIDDGVFFISSDTSWTPKREAGTWRAPVNPTITMMYVDRPQDAVLH